MKMSITKNAALFIFLTFCFSLSSCGDDDTLSEVNTLIGTWNVVAINASSSTLGSVDAAVSGTITFKSGGTGQEDYTWSALGETFNESNGFTWISTTSTITFDPGDVDETVWSREVNDSSNQRGTYTTIIDGQSISITISLSK